LERHRLQRDSTQAEMAEEAGIGRATLQRLERGQSVQSVSLVKLMRALGLLQALDAALPEAIELPIVELEREQRRTRQRARGSGRRARRAKTPEQPWIWGEEPGAGR
jgi:transcriptional regulator with XRE-family HTH domain